MPGLNRKGPDGKGSRTGRGMGRCHPNSRNHQESFENNQTEDFEKTSESTIDTVFVPGEGREMINRMLRGMNCGMGRRNGRGNGRGFGRGSGRGFGR